MAVPEPSLEKSQQRQRARFQRMRLSARPMPGGRSLLVSLRLGPAPFESIGGPMAIERVVFSTVGANSIKCLRPRPLFGLPLLDIRRCVDAAAIESKIRQAFRERTQELRETGQLLKSLGLDVGSVEGGSALAFPLSGESPDARILMQRVGEAILPSTGPLSGLSLESVEDRVLEVGESLDSGADLECLVGTAIESLRRRYSAKNASSPRSRQMAQPAAETEPPLVVAIRTPLRDAHRPKVLLVGQKLIEDKALRDELSRQGYFTATARSETEALVRLAGMSPDLVISQYGLGRSDGATLIQATRALPGIERIPVVLLDDIHHASRREAARAVGAAGYLLTPPDMDRFVARLKPVIETPGNRRFTRYPQRLAARFEGSSGPCLATEVGRGGIFLATSKELQNHESMNCEVTLPEIGRAMKFGGEVLYRKETQGNHHKGLGLRFCDISSADEAALIEYLGWLESTAR